MKTKLLLVTALLCTSGLLHAREFDAKHFVNTKCIGCHDSSVYTRSNRMVKTLPQLESQVRMCDANLGTTLFDEDVHGLVNYLNDKYYQFGK